MLVDIEKPNAAANSPELVTLETMIPDFLGRHPHARRVFDRYGLNGCGGRLGPVESIGFFARTHGVPEDQLLAELQQALQGSSAHVVAPDDDPPAAPSVADTIYRRFFTAGIVLVLTAGATWGAWLLWNIGFGGSFTSISIFDVNAHGHAQIFGWVGLFIMGFAYQAFPRMWHTRLAAPRLAVAAFLMMLTGLIVRTAGMTLSESWSLALPAAVAGGLLEIGAVLAFAGQLAVTFRRSGKPLESYVGFAFGAIFWFVAMSVFSLWHTYHTMAATTREELLWYVATYQAPLRDLQIHGLALFMILGVCMRMLPPLFGVAAVPAKWAWAALGLATAAVAIESVLFIAYRWTGNHALAGGLWGAWLMLATGVVLVAWPWRLWRPLPSPEARTDRSSKFVRAAYGWLAISLLMLLMLPVYQAASGIPFSHAYYGAIRHAITVGFISLMIMGFAAKVVPTLNGVDPRRLTSLWGPFILVNLGCFLRVSMQTLTDWDPVFFSLVGVSGTLEVVGLAWWGVGLVCIMRQGKREANEDAVPSRQPDRIEPHHRVGEVLAWFPATEEVFVRFGFSAVRNPILRRTVARQVTITQVCGMHNVSVDELLTALNAARVPSQPQLVPLSISVG